MFFCISFLSYCHTGKLNNRTVNDFSQIYVSYIADILPIVNHWQDISSSLSPSCILIRSVLSTYILEFRANWNQLVCYTDAYVSDFQSLSVLRFLWKYYDTDENNALPLTCHIPVIPGLIAILALWCNSYWRSSSCRIGLVPTRLILPPYVNSGTTFFQKYLIKHSIINLPSK